MVSMGIETISWNEVKASVAQLNPALFNIIEQDKTLIPDELKILSYNYGSQVGDDAYFYFPNGEKSLAMPFCMVYENNFEMYMEFNSRISPWKIYKPGQVFPYTKFLTNNALYEPADMLRMTAGIRNAFLLLNKFSDKKRHAWLEKKYHFSCEPPQNFDDQFHIFKGISDYVNPLWKAKLLAFPKQWEEKAYLSPYFVNYLNSIVSDEYIFKRNILLYDHILNTIHLKFKIINNSFVREVIRYLFFIACGDQPGYLPTSDECNAPINIVQEAYIDIFKSETIPIFMIPFKLSPFHSLETVYYSLNKVDFLFKPNQISNLNKLSQEIIYAFKEICLKMNASKIAVNTIFHQCSDNIDIHLIHRWNTDNENNEVLFYQDNFIKQEINRFSNLDLPLNSLFLSACFAIRYTNLFF